MQRIALDSLFQRQPDVCVLPIIVGVGFTTLCRDQTVQQGLEYVASWNSSQLLTEDIQKSLNAAKQKSEPLYSRL